MYIVHSPYFWRGLCLIHVVYNSYSYYEPAMCTVMHYSARKQHTYIHTTQGVSKKCRKVLQMSNVKNCIQYVGAEIYQFDHKSAYFLTQLKLT